MSEIKNVGYTWMAKCNQLTPLPFKGLKGSVAIGALVLMAWYSRGASIWLCTPRNFLSDVIDATQQTLLFIGNNFVLKILHVMHALQRSVFF